MATYCDQRKSPCIVFPGWVTLAEEVGGAGSPVSLFQVSVQTEKRIEAD